MRFFQWNVSSCSSRCPFHSVSTSINICSSAAEKRNRCRVNEHPGVQPNLTPACCVHCSLPPQSRWRCWSACDLWWECADNAFNAFSVFLLIYLWSNPLKSHLQVLIPIALLLLSFSTLFFLCILKINDSDFMYYLVELDCSLFLLIGESQFMYYILGRLGLGLSLYIGLNLESPFSLAVVLCLVSNSYIKITSKIYVFQFLNYIP